MINFRSALGAKFTIAVVVISLFAFILALTGCEIQDLGIAESAAPPRGEVSLSVSSQSPIPANPPAWDANTLYNKAGLYVTHKGKVWVSQWSITKGAEPGKNSWNGWKIAETASRDKANPKPWNADVTYGGKGYYVTHKGSTWVSKWSITRGAEPGANTWNGWKQVSAPPKWVTASAGVGHALAINEKGELYAWGRNSHGQLGDGTATNRNIPTKIGSAVNWKLVDAGRDHSLAVKNNGELYAWGKNNNGVLGDGTRNDRNTPTRIGTSSDWVQVSTAGSNLYGHSLAVNTKGELYAWGKNDYGQLGVGDNTTTKLSPTRVGTAVNWARAAAGNQYSLAVNTSGELYAWGRNSYGQLGDGTTIDRNTPTKIGSAADWSRIQAGFSHSLALNTKGELYAWGYNSYGQLGNGENKNHSSPQKIGADADWVRIDAEGWRSSALKSSGELYTWGSNSSGQLGDGTNTNRNTPTKVGTADNWSEAYAGAYHSAAVNSKGELYTWGNSSNGKLGDGSTANRSSPVKIAHP